MKDILSANTLQIIAIIILAVIQTVQLLIQKFGSNKKVLDDKIKEIEVRLNERVELERQKQLAIIEATEKLTRDLSNIKSNLIKKVMPLCGLAGEDIKNIITNMYINMRRSNLFTVSEIKDQGTEHFKIIIELIFNYAAKVIREYIKDNYFNEDNTLNNYEYKMFNEVREDISKFLNNKVMTDIKDRIYIYYYESHSITKQDIINELEKHRNAVFLILFRFFEDSVHPYAVKQFQLKDHITQKIIDLKSCNFMSNDAKLEDLKRYDYVRGNIAL